MRIRRRSGLSSGGTATLLAGALAAATLSGAPAFATGPTAPNSTGTTSTSPKRLTEHEASAQAKATGKPVTVDALTTETSQTTANPDGTLTLTQSAVPVRMFRNGAWAELDATLKTNSDGTLSPSATPGSVVLSGGGTGPLAALLTGGQGLTLTLSVALPKPTLTGNTAVYAEVLPGVDLTVTVRESGAVSDVFTVKTKQAAQDPRLADLLKAKADTTAGLTTKADANGNLTVSDSAGRSVYTAPVPLAWDSTPLATTAQPAGAQTRALVQTESEPSAPSQAAHSATLEPTVTPGSIELAAPTALLNAADTVYPVFLDPTYSPNWGQNGYSSPSAHYPGQNYWNNTVDPTAGITQIGNSGIGESLSLFNFPIDRSVLSGAVISGAYFGITETHSWACPTSGHNQSVGAYGPSGTLDANNATWNYWSAHLGSRVGNAQSFALGYNSSCPAGGIPAFDVTSTINAALADPNKSVQTIALRAEDHSDNYAFKEFQASTAILTVSYDKVPDTPTRLYTSPATNCSSTVLGDTSVTLYAPVSTPTNSALTTTFTLYKTLDPSHTNLLTPANGISSNTYTNASGQTAVMPVPETLFKAAAGTTPTSFGWQVITGDGTLSSSWSNTCTFNWDASRPGAPTITPSGTQPCPVESTAGSLPQVGTQCVFTLTVPKGPTTTGFQYQLNQNPAGTVNASGGTATVTVPVERLVNTLTVTAFSSGGNLGSSVTVTFDGSTINPPAKDGDLNLDNTPDLIVPGTPGTAFPSGLWLSTGHADGTVTQNSTNIGVNGLNTNTDSTSADWDGAQTITGNFCGNGAQDVLAYFPSGTRLGGASITCSDGSTNPLRTILGSTGSTLTIGANSFKDGTAFATQLVNAGNTSGNTTGNPDLLAPINNHLVLLWATNQAVYKTGSQFSLCKQGCTVLTGLNTPDGSQNWNDWTLATTQLADGTAMYLWKPTTGALYLWTGLSKPNNGNTLTTTHQFTIAASGWNMGKSLQLRAGDISGTGVPGLWATDRTTGQTTSYQPATLADPLTVKTATTAIATPNHAWKFQDMPEGGNATALTTTADTSGTYSLNGTSGAQWNTGDLYGTDVLLNTAADGSTPSSAHGVLTASGSAVTFGTGKDLTVAARAKPNRMDGVVVSQGGSQTSGMMLYPDSSTNTWAFCMASTDGADWPYDCIRGGTVHLGMWAQLTATYQAKTGMMTLYVDGVETAAGRHTSATGFTGAFQVGAYKNGGVPTGWYSGQIADVATWNGVVPPVQPQTPGGRFSPVANSRLLDTRNGTGGATGPITASGVIPVQVTGNATVPTSKVSAAMVSVTATSASGDGFLTLYPDGTPKPVSSHVNYTSDRTVTNSVIVPLGGNGKFDAAVSTGGASVQIIIDVTGYFTTDTTATSAGKYLPIAPTRVIDTRNGTGGTSGPIGPGGKLIYTAANGAGGKIPSSGVAAVALSLTSVNATGPGYLTTGADGSVALGSGTMLSFTDTAPVSVMQIVPLSSSGKLGILNNYGGSTDVIADVVGYFTAAPAAGTGQLYHPMDSTRMVDTRLSGSQLVNGAPQQFGTPSPVSAVSPTYVVNLTSTASAGLGYIAATPAVVNPPAISNLSYRGGVDQAATDLASTATDGTFQAIAWGGSTHLVIDANGYFASY
ncbi:hypothetical protein [Kitasatospora cineracea]|uniref:hypothetical protein n=1 Tax=Kitasatospora cineracea TaxID=88074 RepID=UPI0037964D5C